MIWMDEVKLTQYGEVFVFRLANSDKKIRNILFVKRKLNIRLEWSALLLHISDSSFSLDTLQPNAEIVLYIGHDCFLKHRS